MSPTVFENLALERAELREAVAGLRRWAVSHPEASFLDPRRVALEVSDVPTAHLAAALTLLARIGRLRRTYKVISPTDGVLADGSFESPLDIPAKLQDTSAEWFRSKDGEVITVFHEGAK